MVNAFGGKDGTPYPVDRPTYDRSLDLIEGAIRRAQLSLTERTKALRRAEAVFARQTPDVANQKHLVLDEL